MGLIVFVRVSFGKSIVCEEQRYLGFAKMGDLDLSKRISVKQAKVVYVWFELDAGRMGDEVVSKYTRQDSTA